MSLKLKELKALSNDELSKKLSEVKMDLLKSNAQIATGTTPKSPGQVRQFKKTIARILAIINKQGGKK